MSDHQCLACIEGLVRALENNKLEDRIARSGYQRFSVCRMCVAEIRGQREGDREAALRCFNRCYPT